MMVRTTLAAGLAALALLVIVSESPAGPGRAGGGPRVGPGPRVTPGPAGKPVVTAKTVVTAKAVVTAKTVTPARPRPFKPGFVRAPGLKGGVNVKTALYAGKFGVVTRGGFVAYKGKGHGQWSRKWYNARLRTWNWFCPSAGGWYYWSGRFGCYLPLRYASVCAPTVMPLGAPVADLPPGADGVPEAAADEVPAQTDNPARNTNASGNTPLDVPEPG